MSIFDQAKPPMVTVPSGSFVMREDYDKLKGRLRAVFYLLMRDHVPTGVLQKLINDARAHGVEDAAYSAYYLRDYADRLVYELAASGTEPL